MPSPTKWWPTPALRGLPSLLVCVACNGVFGSLGGYPASDDGSAESGPGDSGSDGGECPDDGCLDVSSGCVGGDENCRNEVDLLFVIDNSGTMGEEQLNLAKNFPLLTQQLEGLQNEDGAPLRPDVNIMVTTTDLGNPLCTAFEEHPPEQGKPISSGCNARIERFGDNPEACTDVCELDIVPNEGDPFIHFDSGGDNVPDVPDKDVNGDGLFDDAVAQALACVGPQGTNGCGFEAPLEAMTQALNPQAPWNTGERSFLREDAVLAIAIITDEADCSVANYAMMYDQSLMEEHPTNGVLPSSAQCWNSGVECTGGPGVYDDCRARDETDLHPLSRYLTLLDELEDRGKEIVMLGILGVPPVTAHADTPPFQPTEGGVHDLSYRDWTEDDLLPGGILELQQWEFGIGPGCTGVDERSDPPTYRGQAIPPVRVREVCEHLNDDDTGKVRCCIESICDDDFSAAITCLTDAIQTVVDPVD